MRILFLGGYGLVGSAALARLAAAGHDIVGLTRSRQVLRLPRVEWRYGDLARMILPEDWRSWIEGIDAVVNCAGALEEGTRDTLENVHVKGPDALYRACVEAGVRRIVHVSAAGIEGIDTAFARTKRESEARLRALDLDWIILRPGLVLAEAAYGGTGLMRGLAGLPFFTPLSNANCVVQTVSVKDVAETIAVALEGNARLRATFELVHPATTTLSDIARAYRAWLCFPPCPILRVPNFVIGALAFLGDAAAHLGWRNPLRRATMRHLAHGVVGSPEAWIEATGIKPRSLNEFLAEVPSTVQERRFARLYFVKPLGIVVLSLFWITSGVIALGPSAESAHAAFLRAGIDGELARLVVAAGALLDIAIGLAIGLRRTARAALGLSVLVSFGYLAAATILRPDLWGDPLGTLVKIFPVAFAAIAVAALMDER
ncbi:MAG TPA: SDR family oxidoreductase [Micropepsaceae bacterium]|nr:SDR family oxidoreductase [Micropepsaceae bacterium]